jgi:hypothetical protein
MHSETLFVTEADLNNSSVVLTKSQYDRLLSFAALAYDGFGEHDPGPSMKDLFDVLMGKPAPWKANELYKSQIEDALKHNEPK